MPLPYSLEAGRDLSSDDQHTRKYLDTLLFVCVAGGREA